MADSTDHQLFEKIFEQMKKIIVITFLFVSSAAMADSQFRMPKSDYSRFPEVVVTINSCPFEGCGFGEWKVTRDSTLYAKPKSKREVGKVSAGQDVIAVTATSFDYPAMARVVGAIPENAKGIDPSKPIWILGVVSEDGEREVRQGEESFLLEIAADKKYCKKPIPFYKKNECWVDIIRDYRDEWWAYITIPESNLHGWILVEKNVDTNNPFS